MRIKTNTRIKTDVLKVPVTNGLVAWFDMLDSSKYTINAGNVNSITNKVSNVVWSQATSGNQPLYSSNKLNGLSCMDFDGSNDIIISTEAAVVAAMTNSPALTVFGVVQSDNADLSVYWLSAGSSVTAGLTVSSRGWGTNTSGTGNYLAGASNDANTSLNIQSATSTGTTNSIIYEYFTDGSVGSIVINGGTPDPNGSAQSIGTLTPTQCGIGGGARQTPNAFFNGAVGEILIYNNNISGTNRSIIRRYLSNKWGINSVS